MSETRWIRGYERLSEQLAQEHALLAMELSRLRLILGTEEDDPVVDAFPLTPDQARALDQVYFGSMRFDQFDYFLECDAE